MRTAVHRLFAAVLPVLLGLSSMAHADPRADRATLEQAAQAWIRAFNARDIDAVMALTTDDVVVLDPGMTIASGRDAVRRALVDAMTGAQGRAASVTKEVEVNGNLAWRIGALSHHSAGEVLGRGQSLEIWQRAGGTWKIHRLMSSGLLTQPRLLPLPLPPEPVLDKPGN